MRLRLLIMPLCLLLTLAISIHLRAEPPTTAPAKQPTTQYSSVQAVFEAIPDDKQPDEPKKNATELQLDRIRNQVKAANEWLTSSAVNQPIHVLGTVQTCAETDRGTITVEVSVDKPRGARVKCTFPKSMADKLITFGTGDAIEIDGTIDSAALDLQVIFLGYSTVRELHVRQCRLATPEQAAGR